MIDILYELYVFNFFILGFIINYGGTYGDSFTVAGMYNLKL